MYVFSSNSLKFLGYLVDKDGSTPDPDRSSLMLAVQSSEKFSEVHLLVDSLQYYSRFTRNSSQTRKPIFDLLSSGVFH